MCRTLPAGREVGQGPRSRGPVSRGTPAARRAGGSLPACEPRGGQAVRSLLCLGRSRVDTEADRGGVDPGSQTRGRVAVRGDTELVGWRMRNERAGCPLVGNPALRIGSGPRSEPSPSAAPGTGASVFGKVTPKRPRRELRGNAACSLKVSVTLYNT